MSKICELCRKSCKRGLNRIPALTMAVLLLGTTIEFPVYATENQVISCEHHKEHTAECGYVPSQEGAACAHVCSEENGCNTGEGICIHNEHDDACGYKEAVEGTPCAFACDTCVSDVSEEPANENQQEEDESKTCTCENKCTEDAVNEECAVCSSEEADLTLCAEFVWELAKGPETVLGERGAGFSEGQMQRIAIARTLYADAPILILDEATGALDENTEKRLLEKIKQLTDKTVILVTHRRAALNICNKVFHVADGIVSAE